MSNSLFSAEEMIQNANDQVRRLRVRCDSYDGGDLTAALDLSIILGLLLNTTKRNKSLLDQLGYQHQRFLSTPGHWIRTDTVAIKLAFADTGAVLRTKEGTSEGFVEWSPRYDDWRWDDDKPAALRRADSRATVPWAVMPFQQWWKEEPILVAGTLTRSRHQLVMDVADKLARHTDRRAPDAFLAFRRQLAMRVRLRNGDDAWETSSGPEFASIRQIAYEIQTTLDFYRPDAVDEIARNILPPPRWGSMQALQVAASTLEEDIHRAEEHGLKGKWIWERAVRELAWHPERRRRSNPARPPTKISASRE